MSDERPWVITTTEWEVRYALEHEPIGIIRRIRVDGRERFRAIDAGMGIIGTFPDGDSASVAVWEAYLAADRARHAVSSRTHGGAGRHPERRNAPPRPAGS